MRDVANDETERLIAKAERQIEKVYRRAAYESGQKLQEYMQRFEKSDAQMHEKLEKGQITEEAYGKWRKGAMLTGKRYEEMLNTLADDYVNADKIAMSIVNGYIPEAYAVNRNYAAFEVEKGAMMDTSFTLYNRETVERLVRERPNLLPKPRVDIPKDRAWNKRKIRSEITQGILQGESIPKVAKRLQNVSDMDKKAAVRNARTAITGAQNAGRADQYQAAADKGIDLMQKWVATLDGRTRDSHRALDGELINVGEKFSNGLRFPGDPLGNPAEVYNCRCRMVGHLTGFSFSDKAIPRRDKLGSMSYEDWKNEHKPYNVTVRGSNLDIIEQNLYINMSGAAPMGVDKNTPIRIYNRSNNIKVTYSTNTGDVTMIFHDDTKEIEIDDVFINTQGVGTGKKFIQDVIDNGRRNGYKEITLFAAGDADDIRNGYYTWARFGFDGKLPSDLVKLAEKDGFNVDMVSDLISTKDGRLWWKKHGRGMYMRYFL